LKGKDPLTTSLTYTVVTHPFLVIPLKTSPTVARIGHMLLGCNQSDFVPLKNAVMV